MVDLICSILRTTPAIINVMKYSSEFATVTSSTEDAGASDWALPEEEFVAKTRAKNGALLQKIVNMLKSVWA